MKYYKSTEIKKRFTFSLFFYFGLVLYLYLSINFTVGVIATFIVVSLLSMREGVEIEFEKERYRSYTTLFGHTFGKGKPLPNIQYVTAVRVLQSSKRYQASSAQYVQKVSFKNYKYNVNLAVDGKQRVIKLWTLSHENALKEALKIGEALDLKVLDYTTPEKNWVR